MMRTTARFETSAEARLRREIDRRAQAAALQATKEAAEEAKGSIRSAMAQAGLGTLGMGIGSGSDAQKTGTVHAKDNGRWSASGWVFIRSQSPRTVGAARGLCCLAHYCAWASWCSAAFTMLAASTPKNPRSAARVSLRPKPSVPSVR